MQIVRLHPDSHIHLRTKRLLAAYPLCMLLLMFSDVTLCALCPLYTLQMVRYQA